MLGERGILGQPPRALMRPLTESCTCPFTGGGAQWLISLKKVHITR